MSAPRRSTRAPGAAVALGALALAVLPGAPRLARADAAASADGAPAAAVDPAAEVRGMIDSMAGAETEVRDSLSRFDGWLEQGRAQFLTPSGTADWRWSLLERVVVRVRALLDPEVLAKAQREARGLLEAGDAEGARDLVVATMRPFMARGEEASMLMNYVPRRVTAGLAGERLRALLRGNGIESPSGGRLAQLEALLAAREARDDFAMAAAIELPELEALQRQAYDAAFLAALASARARPAASLKYQDRSARCPLAADTGPPGDAPRLDTTLSAPTSAYYPKEALDQDIEGKVAVSARVDPQGCVRAAAVLVSTGVEALDAAALRWMLEGAVYRRSTARAGGELATTSLSVNFKSTE